MSKNEKMLYGGIALVVVVVSLVYTIAVSGTTQTTTPSSTNQSATGESSSPINNTSSPQPPMNPTSEVKNYTRAVITTNKGVIEVELDTNKKLTVGNFGKLADASFYNGVRFHRVIKGFMIQAGDPLSKDLANKNVWGTGGPGYKFNDELVGNEQYTTGTLAMANAGPNTNGSQFFIVTAQPGVPLPASYTVFGKVTKGLEVALSIENVPTNSSDQPLEDVIIETIEMK
ncbi:MAG: hypothetical protein RI935_28 [Candidatus Parcubacteria bacterium]|jgi:cyclophilin family peptidyl-prolyl cis-trans isomerase